MLVSRLRWIVISTIVLIFSFCDVSMAQTGANTSQQEILDATSDPQSDPVVYIEQAVVDESIAKVILAIQQTSIQMTSHLKIFELSITVLLGLMGLTIGFFHIRSDRKLEVRWQDWRETSETRERLQRTELTSYAKGSIEELIDAKLTDMGEEIKEEIFTKVYSLSGEAMMIAGKSRGAVFSRLERFRKDLYAQAHEAGEAQRLGQIIDMHMMSVIRDWYVLTQLFAADKKQIAHGLEGYIRHPFDEGFDQIQALCKTHKNDHRLYPLLDEAKRSYKDLV